MIKFILTYCDKVVDPDKLPPGSILKRMYDAISSLVCKRHGKDNICATITLNDDGKHFKSQVAHTCGNDFAHLIQSCLHAT